MTQTIFILFTLFQSTLFATSEIRIGAATQPESLFFPIANDHVSDLVTQLVVEPLVTLDLQTNQLTARLAQSWTVHKNTIQFKLNPKAKFSNGEEVRADDVLNTFNAFKNKKIPSPDFESQLGSVKSVATPDPHTITFTFNAASVDHLQRFVWMPILSAKTIDEIEAKKNYARELSGSGPYSVESVEPGNKITLIRNKNYWGDKEFLNSPKFLFEKVSIKIIPDYNTQIEMLKNGAIDYLPILSSKSWNTDLKGPAFDNKQIIKSQTESKLNYQVTGIVWNTRLALFQSVKTRRALSHLFPVQKFITNFFYDSYKPASGIFHPQSECHSLKNAPQTFDPELAARLLSEEGWVKNKDGYLYNMGKPFQFKLIVRQAASLRHLTLFQEELNKVGIRMTLQPLDWVVALNRVRTHDFEASEYSMDRPVLLSEYKSQWETNGGLNYSGLSDKSVDQLFKKIDSEFNVKKRLQLCQELDEAVSKLHPLAFGWEQVYLRLAYTNRFETTANAIPPYATWRNAFHHWNEKRLTR